jgi:ABC-2 type transport system ATP-binding protein
LGKYKKVARPQIMSNILEVNGLRKLYNDKVALDGLSFEIPPAHIVGLLGPNGAGKTTTINMIMGVLEPTAGTAVIDGVDVAKNKSKALLQANFAAVYAPMPGNLTVYENLKIFALLYGIKRIDKTIKGLLKQFDIEKFSKVKCGILSSGEAARVNLAKAMVNQPKLLLLDEPTASLDPSSARDVRQNICALTKEKKMGVLWTSHNMHEVEEVCDRVIFLSHGKMLLSGDPKRLPGEHNKKNLEELFITVAKEPLTLENDAV